MGLPHIVKIMFEDQTVAEVTVIAISKKHAEKIVKDRIKIVSQ